MWSLERSATNVIHSFSKLHCMHLVAEKNKIISWTGISFSDISNLDHRNF
jgi:hypothetical protein